MCGRGAIDYDWATLWAWMQLPGEPPDGHLRRLNIAPSTRKGGEVVWTRMPVVRLNEHGTPRLDELVWPLIPPWLHGELPKFSTANCRSESDRPFGAVVRSKPAFRNAWYKGRRCLVPMSWFYEWDKRQKPSQPWRIRPREDPLLVMAGLWDRTSDSDGQLLDSFTIITTGPNSLLERIGHQRAPVLLRPDRFEQWLQGDEAQAEALIRPPPDEWLVAEPVTRRVNNPGFQGEALLHPEGDPVTA
ncbi:MAG: SOS response-associated peptidase [Wenzhouxiangellaceae bacterium]